MGVDGTYRTIFGPAIAHSGEIYGVCNQNVRLALRRLTARRGPANVDIWYNHAQRLYFAQNIDFTKQLHTLFTKYIYDFKDMVTEADEHHADEHPKKRIRIEAWKDLIHGGYKSIQNSDDLWLKRVLYKMKKDEIAKPGKYPRMIGDLGVAASLQGFRLTEVMKHVMADHPIAYKGGHFEFCIKPEASNLARIFRELMSPTGSFYFVYFSDDGCLSIRRGDDVYVYNLDIKWCDGSHGPAVFQTLIDVTPEYCRETMTRIVGQCKLPIVVHDADDPLSKRRVILKPKHPRLYSGSTLTTLINNMANIYIAKSIIDSGAHDPEGIILAANLAGYGLSVDQCLIPEDIQFLKHSPVLDLDSNLRAMLNVGVLLRATGVCRGDLPGKGDLSIRAKKFQAALLDGMYPRCHFPLRENLYRHTLPADAVSTKVVTEMFSMKFGGALSYSQEHFTVSADNAYLRYRLTQEEIVELDELFGNASYQQQFASTGVAKILQKDYGLTCKTDVDFD